MVRALASRVVAWLHTAWAAVVRTVRRVVVAVRRTVTVIVARHQQRAATDAQYRSAIAAGVTAVVGTVTDRPGLAASIGVLLSDRYRVPVSSRPWVGPTRHERPTGGWTVPTRRTDAVGEWDDDLEEEEDGWDPNAGPLWRGYR